METIIEVKTNDDDPFGLREGFFIKIQIPRKDNKGYITLIMDDDIIDYFNFTEEYYNDLLLNKFNGKIIDDGIFFNKKKEANKLKQWFEDNMDSLLVIRALEGK